MDEKEKNQGIAMGQTMCRPDEIVAVGP